MNEWEGESWIYYSVHLLFIHLFLIHSSSYMAVYRSIYIHLYVCTFLCYIYFIHFCVFDWSFANVMGTERDVTFSSFVTVTLVQLVLCSVCVILYILYNEQRCCFRLFCTLFMLWFCCMIIFIPRRIVAMNK